MKEFLIGFYWDEDGMQTIEMVIILVILVALGFAFRGYLVDWFSKLVKEPTEQIKSISDVDKLKKMTP